MSNGIVEALFLAALFAPPLAVVVGALLLLVRVPARRHQPARTRLAHAHR
jgi:hypothetical protein